MWLLLLVLTILLIGFTVIITTTSACCKLIVHLLLQDVESEKINLIGIACPLYMMVSESSVLLTLVGHMILVYLTPTLKHQDHLPNINWFQSYAHYCELRGFQHGHCQPCWILIGKNASIMQKLF